MSAATPVADGCAHARIHLSDLASPLGSASGFAEVSRTTDGGEGKLRSGATAYRRRWTVVAVGKFA